MIDPTLARLDAAERAFRRELRENDQRIRRVRWTVMAVLLLAALVMGGGGMLGLELADRLASLVPIP